MIPLWHLLMETMFNDSCDNKVKDQPEQCKKLHTIYDNCRKNVK